MLIRTVLLFLVAAAPVLSAQTQVADLATNKVSRASRPQNFVQVGSTTYFVARGDEYTYGIWTTDGTPEGTELFIDVSNNSTSTLDSGALLLTGFQGELYFIAIMSGDISRGSIFHLWRTDASTGEIIAVKELPGLEYQPQAVVVDGRLYLTGVGTSNSQAELWVSDGTSEGTHSLTDPQHATFPYDLTAVGDDVYFTASSDGTGREVWKTDGTVAGTNMVVDLYPGSEPGARSGAASHGPVLAELDGELYFSGRDDSSIGFELWKTDGTAAGTTLVKDVNLGPGSSLPREFAVHDGALYFRARIEYLGDQELWKSDGTANGTMMVKKINVSGSSDPRELTSTPLGLIFEADDGVHGPQPWISDGTTTGTKLLKELPTPGNSSFTVERHFSVSGSEVYFIAVDPTVSEYLNLYRTDGTSEGTTAIHGEHGGVEEFHSTGSQLLFSALGDDELWSASGASTQFLKDLNSDAGSILASGGAAVGELVGSKFVFTGEVGTNHADLWVSDGTSFGTSLLKKVSTGYSGAPYKAISFLSHDGLAFFNAYHGTSDTQALWCTNGTLWGTRRLSGDEFNGRPVGVVDDKVIFLGYNSSGSPVIGTSDGTVSGTHHFDLPSLNSITSSAVAGGKMYFYASTASNELALWVSDGTPSGTMRLESASWYDGWWSPSAPAHEYKGDVYFIARDSASGSALRKTDGTPLGTEFVSTWSAVLWRTSQSGMGQLDAANANGRMIFAGADVTNGVELWVSDGTSGGTNMLLDVYPGDRSADPEHLTHYEGRVYFSATTPDHGRELWVSDGTASGTYMLSDINPGIASSRPENFHVFDGLLYFSASDNAHGRELWRTDGTTHGTQRVSDVNPGPASASPDSFFEVGGDLYFYAFRATDGRELWRLSSDGGGGGDSGGCAAVGASGGLAPAALAVLAVALARRRTRRARPETS